MVPPVVFGVGLVLSGCILNNVALELIVREDPSAGLAITLAQFIVISLEGFLIHLEFPRAAANKKQKVDGEEIDAPSSFGSVVLSYVPRLRPRTIPITRYLVMVILFWMVSVLNNAAFAYHIPVPLHMIVRSGSLITSASLGWALFGKRYSFKKIVAIASVTLGVAIATTASANSKNTEQSLDGGSFDLGTFSLGISILFGAMVLSSLLGLYQEHTYKMFQLPGQEKPFRETMFYSHALSLPLFAFSLPTVIDKVMSWGSDAMVLPVVGVEFPRLWAYLVANVLTQYLCIRGVFVLTGNLTSLSTTLTITVRKFVSLMLSVMYFQNPFTPEHWMGTAFVFGGTLLYVMGG